jgi:hypothetical protein
MAVVKPLEKAGRITEEKPGCCDDLRRKTTFAQDAEDICKVANHQETDKQTGEAGGRLVREIQNNLRGFAPTSRWGLRADQVQNQCLDQS